jgi:ATP-dependent DNA ligase
LDSRVEIRRLPPDRRPRRRPREAAHSQRPYWTKRYPWIAESALKNRQKHFVIDGEAVIHGVDGISDFDALHSGKHDEEVQLYAFGMLAGDGDDLRQLPLSMRKTNLARLLAQRTPSYCHSLGKTARSVGGCRADA